MSEKTEEKREIEMEEKNKSPNDESSRYRKEDDDRKDKESRYRSGISKEEFRKEYRDNGKRIWVGNLSFRITKKDLEEEFSRFGKVLHINLPNIDGKQKGYAFIEFET